ncbi:proteasome inhibitor PI31 subunit-like [Oppia nitens]|uniref:proteasome inhibitor PI31 subunit-like n=1 Tax=Oppia nitens TaxID=1686743 RepID=UPI0023DA3F4E|nr:proteasome inhibitor PI31 subunit-like [Oppia nitens]
MVGFELLYQSVGPQLRSRNDLLVACLHFQLIQKDYRFLGTGEQFTETDDTNGSELLSDGWNQSQDTYVLRYVSQKKSSPKQKLLVKCVVASDMLIISALIVSADDKSSSHTFRTNDFITADFKTFNKAFTSGNANNLLDTINRDIVDKLSATTTTTRESGTSSLRVDRQRQQQQEPDPLLADPPPPYGIPNYGGLGYDGIYGQAGQWPPPIGGADLDPFGRGQGGMIMDPRAFPNPLGGRLRNPAPGLPPGAVPPGARFDPFGPGIGPRPNRNPRQMGPDPDHMPPPGYDDMFM